MNYILPAHIVSMGAEFSNTNKRMPSFADFKNGYGVSRDQIRRRFVNLQNLHKEIIKVLKKDEIANSDDKVYSDIDVVETPGFFEVSFENRTNSLLNLSEYNRFVVTTAVSHSLVDKNSIDNIREYCKKNDAKLLILPLMYGLYSNWLFDEELRDETFITEEQFLNQNISLLPVKISARAINPINGIDRISQHEGSVIVPSPKQDLIYSHAPTSPGKLPRARMSTGAITQPRYISTSTANNKSTILADIDHTIGAIIVEIQDDKIFHFRQIRMDEYGNFRDLAKDSAEDLTLICGDWHTGNEDDHVLSATLKMMKTLHPKRIIIHDFFDGFSVNHHDIGKVLTGAKRVENLRSNLEMELALGCYRINWFLKNFDGELIMVMSNHDEFLERYLDRGGYIGDLENLRKSLEISLAKLDGKNPVQFAYESMNMIDDPSRITWLVRDESYKVAGFELGDHGDKGMNGSRASLNSVEKAHIKAVVGHTHSGAIQRNVFRVGTSTKLKLSYNVGPSSWTQTHCLLDSDGNIQLVNLIDGEYTA